MLSTLRVTASLSSTIIFDDSELPLVGASSSVTLTSFAFSVELLHPSFSYPMAPFSSQSPNKLRSIRSGITSVTSTPPEVIALICSSVLIFLVFLSSAIVLIGQRLRHRNQSTTQVEAQVQAPPPPASESKEQVEDVLSPTSSSSKSLVSKTSAALSKDDKYTTLPLRRSRHARQSRIEEKNPIFDLSTSLAALDAEIVNSETARRHSHRLSSARSISLTTETAISGSPNASTRSEFQTCSIAALSGSGDQSPIRPSPMVMSMEARPPETDAVALPDAGTLFVSGSILSFSSISSALSLSSPSVCQPAASGHLTNEAEASNLLRRCRMQDPSAAEGSPCTCRESESHFGNPFIFLHLGFDRSHRTRHYVLVGCQFRLRGRGRANVG